MFTFSLLTPGPDDYSFKASLLSFDGDTNVLADPSWCGSSDIGSLQFMESHLKRCLAILLSHPTPEFISGFILLCINFPHLMTTIPTYSTLPVNQLGRISTVEYFRAHGILGPLLSAITELDDVDEWFDKITILKYLQSTSLLENSLHLVPHNAGHTLGGTFWVVTKRLERIVYAPAWNHSRDSFLNSAAFLSGSSGSASSQLLRPTALITSSNMGSTMPHKKRTEKFLQLVDATLANGGAAVLPTSITGRFLELFRLVDEHLQGAPIPVYFISYSGTKVLSYASNLLDWMSPSLVKEWEEASIDPGSRGLSQNLPFDPSKVDLLIDPNELIQLSGPKIVFCSGNDMDGGDLSSQVFRSLCRDEKTTVILTEKSLFGAANTVGSVLYREWYELAKKKSGKTPEDGIAVPLERTLKFNGWTKSVPLQGKELIEFNEKFSNRRQERMLAKVKDKQTQNLLNADPIGAEDSSDDDDDEDEDNNDRQANVQGGNGPESGLPEGSANVLSAASTGSHMIDDLSAHEAFVTDRIKRAMDKDLPLDLKITVKLKPRQAMFPFSAATHKTKFDDYGEVIDIKQFEKADETNNSAIILEGKRKFEQSERRRWGNAGEFNKQSLQLDSAQDDGRPGKRGHNKKFAKGQVDRLTPQEMTNNQLLQKYLDTLNHPQKQIKADTLESEVRVRCGLSFVDLSGLVDLRSLSIIVQALKPYNLLLLPDFTASAGDMDGAKQVSALFKQQQESKREENKKSLLNSARYLSLESIRSGFSSLVSPYGASSKMKIVEVTADVPVKIGSENDAGSIGLSNFEVKLDDEVLADLKWQEIDGSYRVAQVYGELELTKSNAGVKRPRHVSDYINSNSQFTLKKVQWEDLSNLESLTDKTPAGMEPNAPRFAIGNVRLPELKKKLANLNLSAEFKGEGILVVNDQIAIKKVAYGSVEGDDTGDIIIEGSGGPLYYQVKECIKGMLAYV